jgi:DNA invertase Pin-like site-specific DNA recombinase
MGSLAGFAAEMEREKASQRMHDAMLRKAKALYVTGNKGYCYDNVPVYSEVCATRKGTRHGSTWCTRSIPRRPALS